MTEQHPITPPPGLVQQWEDDILNERDNVDHVLDCAWINGFQAGADHQLAEDAKWLDQHALDAPHLKITPVSESLKEAMRPKPPSLKEQALAALQEAAYMADDSPPQGICADQIDIIRRALEALPE